MLLEDLNVILKVAEFRSITAAAESLDMQTATASAAIKRVERALGVELFIRTTRRLRLSVAGEKYIPNCQQALQMLDLAKQNVKKTKLPLIYVNQIGGQDELVFEGGSFALSADGGGVAATGVASIIRMVWMVGVDPINWFGPDIPIVIGEVRPHGCAAINLFLQQKFGMTNVHVMLY